MMERLTRLCKNTEGGKYSKYVIGNYNRIYSDIEFGKAVDKLGYYEDLEEQGRLQIFASNEDQLKMFKDKCKICMDWNGESCKKIQCPVYVKIKELIR